MVQQPARCVLTSPLPARELGVAERIAGGLSRHVRAPRAVAVIMLTITVQRVEDVRRQQLLAPQTVEPMVCRLVEGWLVLGRDRCAAWDTWARLRGRAWTASMAPGCTMGQYPI